MSTDQEHTTETYHSSDHDGDLGPNVVTEPAISPVMFDPRQHYNTVVQHLGIEIANRAVATAELQAKVAMALQAYGALSIDTWVRHISHEPSPFANGDSGDVLTLAGPISIPPEEHEALSRFLAAVEGLR